MTSIYFDFFKTKEKVQFSFTKIKKKYYNSFQNDVHLILANAKSLTNNQKISGHTILSSVNEHWEKLKLNSFEK